MDYHLDFHSMPKILFAAHVCREYYKLDRVMDPQCIEISYITKGYCLSRIGGENEPFIEVPQDCVFIEIFDKPNLFLCPEYHEHSVIGFHLQFDYLKSGGMALPKLLPLDGSNNEIRPMLDQLIKQYHITPDSSILTAMLFELMARISLHAQARLSEGPQYGKEKYVQGAKQYILDHMAQPIRISDIASHLNLSQGYLSHIFRQEEGKSILEYIHDKQVQRMEELLLIHGMHIQEACRQVGIRNVEYARRLFRKVRGYNITELWEKNQMYAAEPIPYPIPSADEPAL